MRSTPMQLLRLTPRNIGRRPIDAPVKRITIPKGPEKRITIRSMKIILVQMRF